MKKNNLSEILMLLCVLVLGVCLTIWADKVTNIVSIFLGILGVLYSIIIFVNYFRNNSRLLNDRLGFIYGIVILVIGFVLIFRVDFLKELISFVIGIYIILTSIIKLHESITISKNIKTTLTSAIVLAILGIVIGILCIVGKVLFPDIIIKYIGIMLILYSVISIINTIIIGKK